MELGTAQNGNNYAQQSKVCLFGQGRSATQCISIPSERRVLLGIHEKWFGMYITEQMRRVHGCYIAEVTDSY